MDFQIELDFAISLVRKAGEYLKAHQMELTEKVYKEGDYNYATQQDLQSDKIIIEAIKSKFPSDYILSEESSAELNQQSRMWIIDPLDGTRNYANGLPYYAVSIALYQDDGPVLGVVYAPSYNDSLFYAVKSMGAFLNNKPLRMFNSDQHLKSSLVVTGFAYFRGEALKSALRKYENVLNNCTDVLRMGSAALDICHVASGYLGAYYESGLKPWDLAGAWLILSESGGKASDYLGNKLNIFKKLESKYSVDVLVAKNESMKKELVKVLSN